MRLGKAGPRGEAGAAVGRSAGHVVSLETCCGRAAAPGNRCEQQRLPVKQNCAGESPPFECDNPQGPPAREDVSETEARAGMKKTVERYLEYLRSVRNAS